MYESLNVRLAGTEARYVSIQRGIVIINVGLLIGWGHIGGDGWVHLEGWKLVKKRLKMAAGEPMKYALGVRWRSDGH